MWKLLDWSVLTAYCALIFWLSAQQSLPMPMAFEFQDKVQHAGAYFVMAVFSWRALRHSGPTGSSLALMSFLFCSIYGISDEWHQAFVPGRNSSVWDWLADSVGAAMALTFLLKFNLKHRYRNA
ncbi:VanZ family protein [Methylomonas sp. LL1]|uniref:VanZ family protein n=1 Tax=Methylomonas sp. LL1 TaxID=2785785 RepID=UPI0018C3AC0E|nr:VanZ family protein [Methylomonas sp. LL1]QPK64576.1 VanZ family protein [Methylomonas sp. LL1]